MMDIIEFMKAIRIEGTDVQVIMLNNDPDQLAVNWLFEVSNHPTLTHYKMSRIIMPHDLTYVQTVTTGVKKQIEAFHNAYN